MTGAYVFTVNRPDHLHVKDVGKNLLLNILAE